LLNLEIFMDKPQVLIVMGSDSDVPVMEEAAKVLKDFGVQWEMRISSAHRCPDRTAACRRRGRGIKTIGGRVAHIWLDLAAGRFCW
jgi:5-(carboxyamino)imidazole ribonucleotide mutase